MTFDKMLRLVDLRQNEYTSRFAIFLGACLNSNAYRNPLHIGQPHSRLGSWIEYFAWDSVETSRTRYLKNPEHVLTLSG